MRRTLLNSLVLTSALVGWDSRADTTGADPVLEARQLWQEYSNNEASGDVAYKDQIIMVKGRMQRVRKETAGTRYGVRFLTYNSASGACYYVICLFDQAKMVAHLKGSEELTIRGKCHGWKPKGQDGEGGDVMLTDCEIIKKP